MTMQVSAEGWRIGGVRYVVRSWAGSGPRPGGSILAREGLWLALIERGTAWTEGAPGPTPAPLDAERPPPPPGYVLAPADMARILRFPR